MLWVPEVVSAGPREGGPVSDLENLTRQCLQRQEHKKASKKYSHTLEYTYSSSLELLETLTCYVQ